jgi:excisionase family DNA binding protein
MTHSGTYSVEQLSEKIKVTTQTIYAWVRDNKISYKKTPGGKIYFLGNEISDTIEFYENQNVQPKED